MINVLSTLVSLAPPIAIYLTVSNLGSPQVVLCTQVETGVTQAKLRQIQVSSC